jgi:hypothetical protein
MEKDADGFYTPATSALIIEIPGTYFLLIIHV